MPRIAEFVVSGLLAATLANGQDFAGSGRAEDAFSYVQPKNTTILGPYGHSPAVLPSRKLRSHCLILSIVSNNL